MPLWFTPDVAIDPGLVPPTVAIKGEMPAGEYAFSLRDVYPCVPSLPAVEAYRAIDRLLADVDTLLHDAHRVRHRVRLPPAADEEHALGLLRALLDPGARGTDPVVEGRVAARPDDREPFTLGDARPFPLELAPPGKLAHTLAWVDSNVKLAVERVAGLYGLPPEASARVAEAALRIYSLLLKQRDYYLARSINFNHSMLMQEKVVRLIFGDAIFEAALGAGDRARAANRLALELLPELGDLSYPRLCTLAVFMGVTWTSGPELQREFRLRARRALATLDDALAATGLTWAADDTADFLARAGGDREGGIAVVLDDNGEAVFDLALFQRLLNDTARLRLTFVLNQYAVSQNIALDSFRAIVADDFFADLRRHVRGGRAAICVERQMFRSFEVAHMHPATVAALREAAFCYVKGANFFETLQLPAFDRYHAFVVHERTSAYLTGFDDGAGVFARLRPGELGYEYHGPGALRTLRETRAAGAA